MLWKVWYVLHMYVIMQFTKLNVRVVIIILFIHSYSYLGEFIIGRVIKAMMSTWHPQCFTCEMCHKELADLGFIKNQGKNDLPVGKY